METKLEQRINATEDLLNYSKNVDTTVVSGNDAMILENQLAIMKELREIRLDTKAIINNTARI